MPMLIKTFAKRPTARIAIVILVVLYGGMILCEFIAPYGATTVFSQYNYHPPNVTWYSPQYGFGPQVQTHALVDPLNWHYARIQGEFTRIRLLVRGEQYKMWGLIPMQRHLFGTANNTPVLLMGADHLGRDLFSRILYGSRISLTIGFIGISISLGIAIILGGLAGYYGGMADWGVMRLAEFFSLVPGLYLILFLRSILSSNLDSGQAFIIITVILSLVGWPGSARLIRGLVHSIKREDYIVAAQLQGVPTMVILFRHIIPQLSSILIVSVALGIPGFILGETVLSYLGLGIIDPAVSWGSLINREVTSLSNLRNFPWFLIPGLFLLLVTLAYNFIGDMLRDAFDPNWYERR